MKTTREEISRRGGEGGKSFSRSDPTGRRNEGGCASGLVEQGRDEITTLASDTDPHEDSLF